MPCPAGRGHLRGARRAPSGRALGARPPDARLAARREDALQEALLRAWRSLPQFEGRGSARWWLYRIATNSALDVIRRRRQLVPIDEEPPDDAADSDPAGRYERREAVEKALVTADRVLTGRQRAVLILREVLGFSAEETANRLDTSVAAVNSALQRARATLDQHADARAA